TTTMGPLVSSEQYERVLGYLKLARDEGAQAKAGGERGPQERGYFVKPTIYTAVRNDMRIAQEEIFGPVTVLIPFKDENDAVLQGNATTYGLAAGVWTKDVSRAHAVARKLRAAMEEEAPILHDGLRTSGTPEKKDTPTNVANHIRFAR